MESHCLGTCDADRIYAVYRLPDASPRSMGIRDEWRRTCRVYINDSSVWKTSGYQFPPVLSAAVLLPVRKCRFLAGKPSDGMSGKLLAGGCGKTGILLCLWNGAAAWSEDFEKSRSV